MSAAGPTLLAADVVDRWLATSWTQAGLVALSTVAIFATVIGLTRIVGLRSFSKMSSFDFAMTVAVGSVMATTATSPSTTLLNGMLGLAILYLAQLAIARARLRIGAAHVVDNSPLLLMHEGQMLREHMRSARISELDLQAKLRQAGITHPDHVLAVVLETTGDVSILQGDGPIDPSLLEGVRGVPIRTGRPAGG